MRVQGLLVLGLVVCLSAVTANATEINLATANYPPYYGPGLDNEGPLTEIVAAAYARVGYKLNVTYVPWARAMKMAKAGKADGLHGAWYSEERAKWFLHSNKLPGNELVFYKRKGAGPESFTTYEDLKRYKIGTVRGYRNPPDFDSAGLQTREAASDKLNLFGLGKGGVDLVLVDRGNAKYILANELPELQGRLEALEPPVEILPMYVLISKRAENYQQKVDDFNRGLKGLTDEGGVEEILRRHGM